MPKPKRLPDGSEQEILQNVCVELASREDWARIKRELNQHHYLGAVRPVGQRLSYLAKDRAGQWLAILVFSAPAKHLKARDEYIGWTDEQRRRRLSLVIRINSRFLLVKPWLAVPNLGSRVLGLVLKRLAADWQQHYGHPVAVIETFVDPAQFCGTVYTASGWTELGQTDGWGRCRRDYYVKHDRPKRLFVRELRPGACRGLQAEHLRPDLAVVEARVPPRCRTKTKAIRSMVDYFKALPDYRQRVECYPLFSLAAIVLLAVLCEAPRGQADLAKFAGGFNQGQRRALGIRQGRNGKCPAPSQATFCRFFAGLNPAKLQESLLAIQERLRGPIPENELVVLDGKEPRHGSGASVLSAVTVPSLHYLGSAMVDQKTNEIPVAQQEVMPALDLQGRVVSLDALHTQDQTARTVVLGRRRGLPANRKKQPAPSCGPTWKRKSRLPGRIFPLGEGSLTEARTQEKNKGREENRAIRTAVAYAEDVGFPFAAQVARLLRQSTGRKDEEVALITSAPPQRLGPASWLKFNRLGWGIENGLHQRLDVSLNDDRCRIQSHSGIWILGMFRRIAVSIYMEWRLHAPPPRSRYVQPLSERYG